MNGGARSIATVTVLAALALSACSSSAHKAAPTTTKTTTAPTPTTEPAAPSAAVRAATKTFITGAGATLVEFERLTAPVATGHEPTVAECKAILVALPRLIKGPVEFHTLALRTPDTYLGHLFADDAQLKNLVLKVCGTPGPQIPRATLPFLVLARDRIVRRLALSGLTL